MAAPLVRGQTAPVAGLVGTAPAATAIGDVVVVLSWEQAGAGIPTHTLQSGFTEWRTHPHEDGTTDGRLSVAFREATVAGAQTYQAYTSSSGTTVWTAIVVLQAGTFDVASRVSNSVTSTGNQAPNPPAVTLDAAKDWLVLAVGCWHIASSTVTPTAPASYANLIHAAGATAGDIGIANRSMLAAASEDPAAFGDNVAPSGTVAATFAIPSPVVVTGTAASTLPSLTQSAAGAVAVAGGAVSALAALTQSAAGSVIVEGAASSTMTALTQSAEGTVQTPSSEGAAASVLPALQGSASGSVDVLGSAFSTFPALTQAADGAAPAQGAATSTLPALQSSSSAVVPVAGAAGSTFPSLASAAVGAVPISGSAASALPALTQAASGTVGDPQIVGEMSSLLPAIASSASGVVPIQGAAATLLPALQEAGDGVVAVAGLGTSVLPALAASAAGEAPIGGLGVSTLPALASVASGGVLVLGVAESIVPALTQSATDEELIVSILGVVDSAGPAGGRWNPDGPPEGDWG